MKKILLLFAVVCSAAMMQAQENAEPNTLPTPVSNQIFYRSSDHQVVIPNPLAFDAPLIDNTYNPETDLGTITFGWDVKSIPTEAFQSCKNLISVVLPSTATSIGIDAFRDCTNLSSITLPEGLVSIGNDAFHGCANLSSITLPEGLKSIGNSAFQDCAGIAELTIPSKVTAIGVMAFRGCTKLSSITLPEGLESIGNDAFHGCANLSSITLPEGLESIGSDAFRGCAGMAELTIPSTVTAIGSGAFYDCESLASITLPEGLESIGNAAFQDCAGIAELTIPSTVTAIGNDAFTGCKKLSSITLPEGLKSIGNYAFRSCAGMAELTIPSTVTAIGDGVFGECSSLASISVAEGNTFYDSRDNCNAIIETATNTLVAGCGNTVIPSSVTAIGDYAFLGCANLSSINLPEGLESIGEDAFRRCVKLSSITLPEGLESIDDAAFQGCSGLESIMVLASTPPTLGGELVFSSVDRSIPVYVPDIDAYSGWGGFTNIKDIDSSKQTAIDEINAAKSGVSLTEDEVTAIDACIAAIEKVTTMSYENFATIENKKQEALAIILLAEGRNKRESALAAIEAAMQGETSDCLTGLVQQYIDIINSATDETVINNARDTAVAVLNSAVPVYKAGKADGLGSLATKQNGPALIVTDKDGNEVILYSPESVEYIKVNDK